MAPKTPADDAPLIDCHAHIFLADMPVTASAWTRPDYDFPVDRYLETLDAHDIPLGVIAGISLYGEYNDYMCAALRTHRRLRGTAIVSPDIDFYALRALRDDGIVGIRLMLGNEKVMPDLGTHRYQVLFRRLRDLGMHVHVAAPPRDLLEMLPALTAQGCDVVFDHFAMIEPGGLAAEAAFRRLVRAAYGRAIWFKVSAAFRVGDLALATEAAAVLLRELGPARLLWGSDAPFVGHEGKRDYAAVLDDFRTTVPQAADRLAISRAGLKLYFG